MAIYRLKSVTGKTTSVLDAMGLWSRHRRIAGAMMLVVTMLASLAGCSDSAINSPHPGGEDADDIVLYSSFSERPKHLDPARSYSSDEGRFIDQIYDPPLQYHYLKRPYQLEANTLTGLPEIVYSNADGEPVAEDAEDLAFSTYVFTLKPGIYYQPHPAFARNADGTPRYRFETAADSAGFLGLDDFDQHDSRELVAADYIYQIKRLADPANLSPIRGLLAEYIVGMADFADTVTAARQQLADSDERYQQTGWLNLDNYPLSGVEQLGDYQFSVRLNGKYPQFKYWLAMHFFAPLPALVDEFYHQPGLADRNIVLDWYPVGTGPFMMTKNDPNEAIILQRNPNYRDDFYPAEGEPGDAAAGLLDAAGARLPLIDKAVYRLEKESIPLWTKFLQGYYDRSGIASDSFDQAISIGAAGIHLSQEMQDMGIRMEIEVVPGTYYLAFNMLDPVVGGLPSPDTAGADMNTAPDPLQQERARKLRQAIAIAYNQEEAISIFANGRGEVAQSPISPGIFGYQSGPQGMNPYVFDWDANARLTGSKTAGAPVRKSLDEARRLLAEAGYPGGRDAVTGEPLVLNLDTPSGGGSASAMQIWMIKQFKKLGIQLNIRGTDYNRFKEKMRSGNAQLFQWGWIADYPDAENFLFLLYSANGQVVTGGAGVNSSNYANADYDRLFEAMKLMPDSPERMTIIKQMLAIYHHDAPWASGWHPHSYVLNNPWVKNTKAHGISKAVLKYYGIDNVERQQARAERNRPVWWPLMLVAALVVLLMIPGYRAYQRRQQARVITGSRATTGGQH
ncbi:ABC transporter substrate-binding protein [Oceanobacter sp. 3_MG-2023]|uniref:ABC transporter substrate-binding protein n=1 Tax=Oceanobacter sp. 3_MG-2023 TaxID=3062622 RepID=UPI002734830D|nr:ABC transporter substrate-binding protein [Oceanobacter sp. 3_MG-2023]MDP2504811.1 ABC transporter substrate-binding protein [Oceanobacter sp. 3_MG-2023]